MRSCSHWLGLSLALLLANFSTSPAPGQGQRNRAAAPASRVFGDPNTVQYPPSRIYHVENYKIGLRLDFDKSEVFGDETVTLRALSPGMKDLYLNSSKMTIDGVSLLTAKGTPAPLAFHLSDAPDPKDTKLWITLDHAYSPDTPLKLHILYHGNPQGTSSRDGGLTWVRPDAANPNRPLEAWSYGWPENNHYLFPCWDYPNDKATTETIVTVPEPLSVVSNGELVSVTHSKGEATYDWVEHVPHTSYLVSIAAGNWTKYSQKYGAKPVEYYVPPGTDEATALRSFGLTPDMIAFYSKIYGVDYPYEKYGQTAAHGFGGGMENISATSLAETTLHDARADKDFPSVDLVSHELAHQWFGDLVTEGSWDDAWLSEGFATFSAALYRGHHDGDDAYRYQIWQDQNTAAREDQTRYRRPIVDRHYTGPWAILDRTTYQKGAVVLEMLRYVMNGATAKPVASTEEPLFKTLKDYLTAYRAKTVETHNLIDAIRTSTGQELDWFFDEWVYKGGYPEYQVHPTYDPATHVETVAVKQAQKTADGTPLFDMPVQLDLYGPSGQHKQVAVRVRKADETFTVPVDFAPQWIDYDAQDHIFKTLAMDEPVDALIARGERDPATMGRLWAAGELGKVKGETTAAVQALSQMLEHDAFYGVRVASAQSLATLGGDTAKTALLQALHQPNSKVRTAAVEGLSQFSKDQQVYAALVKTLQTDDSYAAAAAAARALGELATAPALDVLVAEVATKPAGYIMTPTLQGLARSKDPRVESILTDVSKSGATEEVRQQATRLLQSMRTGAPPRGQP
jgi:aminopeptidase N